MPATEQLVIDLPADVLDLVRSRVASGKYANESEVIQEALLDTILPPIHTERLEHWIRTEGVRRYDAMRADPSRSLSIDEAFAGLDSES
jgi:antitoxin ParD1/3/4